MASHFSTKTSEFPTLKSHNQHGQVLFIQLIALVLITLLFLHNVDVSRGLIHKQETQLAADLVALSAARVEAEVLQFIGALNDSMRDQTRLMVAALAAPILAAATVIGLPLVPHLVNVASQVVPRVIKSLKTTSQFQKKIIQGYPALMTLEIWRVARANGFSGALPTSKPTLPVSPKIDKFIKDVINIFGISSSKSKKASPSLLKKILIGEEPEVTKNKITDPREDKKIKKSLSTLTTLRKKISPNQLFLANYLDDRWINDQLNVVCWTPDGHIRVASAQVTHSELSHTDEGINNEHNNYVTRQEAQNSSLGFHTKLTAFPDYLKKIPKIHESLDKMEPFLKQIPFDIPIKKEHFKWIQH